MSNAKKRKESKPILAIDVVEMGEKSQYELKALGKIEEVGNN
jgi:hypothetical protein